MLKKHVYCALVSFRKNFEILYIYVSRLVRQVPFFFVDLFCNIGMRELYEQSRVYANVLCIVLYSMLVFFGYTYMCTYIYTYIYMYHCKIS